MKQIVALNYMPGSAVQELPHVTMKNLRDLLEAAGATIKVETDVYLTGDLNGIDYTFTYEDRT